MSPHRYAAREPWAGKLGVAMPVAISGKRA